MIAVFPAPPGPSIGIGPLELRAYGLMIALGVLAAIWLTGRRLEQRSLGTRDDAAAIALWAVGAGLIGARLYHVITDWHRFRDDLTAIPAIWEGGLGIPGGLLAGIVVGLWAARRRGIDPAAAATCAAPAIPLAQGIGRWGNWFNQELFGGPTTLPWALEVDPAYLPTGYALGTTFHPTFLYESLWLFALTAFLLWFDKHHDPGPGRLMGVYVLGYAIGRFWVEGLRIDPATEIAGVRVNQWVSGLAIIGAAIYLFATRGATWPEAVEPDSTGDVADVADRDLDDGETAAIDADSDVADIGDDESDHVVADGAADPEQ